MTRSYYKTKGEFEDSWHVLHIDDATRQGFVPYFGYHKKEDVDKACAIHRDGALIQQVINDILRNGRDKYCVVKFPGSIVEVWIIPNHNQDHPHPYIKQEEEK